MTLAMIAVGLPAVNAIAATCAAPPGIVTDNDLPLLTSRGFVPSRSSMSLIVCCLLELARPPNCTVGQLLLNCRAGLSTFGGSTWGVDR